MQFWQGYAALDETYQDKKNRFPPITKMSMKLMYCPREEQKDSAKESGYCSLKLEAKILWDNRMPVYLSLKN